MRFSFFIFVFYLFLFSILSVGFASATITPNQLQLNFEIVKGKEVCKLISLSSDEPTTGVISDVWAEEYNKESSLSKFTYSAGDHGLVINYEKNLEFDEAGSIDVNVCITASNIGKYQGALIFAPQGESGNVIQYSTWLKVIISESNNVEASNSNSASSSSGGSGGGGGGSSASVNSSVSEEGEVVDGVYRFDELENENNNPSSAQITGSVVSGSARNSTIGWIVLIIVIFLIGLLVYKRRSLKKGEFNE